MEKKTKRDLAGMTMKLRSHSKQEQDMFPPASIQSLPEEVLLHIFSHLTLGEVCNTVAKVCKQWERLHWDHQLYRLPSNLEDLVITRENIRCLNDARYLASPYFADEYIKNIVEKFVLVYNEDHEICVNYLDKVLYKEIIIILAHLRVVKLDSKPAFPGSLSHLFRMCVQVEELSLIGSGYYNNLHLNDSELVATCDQLCGTLRVLHVGFRWWTVKGGRALRKCTHLEDLTVKSGRGWTDSEPSVACLREIANMSSLRRLRFEMFKNKNETVWISMFSNHSLKDLTSLTLILCCNINDNVVGAVGANLKNLTELLHQPVDSDCLVTRKGLEAIIRGCNKLTRLEVKCGGQQSIGPAIKLIPENLSCLKKLAVVCRDLVWDDWKTPPKKTKPGLVIREKFS